MAVSLSWTAAARYEKCPALQGYHKRKETDKEDDERNFLMGRVVHAALERFIAMQGTQKLTLCYVWSWPAEEADAQVRWRHSTDRDEVYVTGWKLCQVLEADLREMDFLKLHLVPEQKLSVQVEDGIRMFAQADVLAYHPTEPVVYLTELKSGKSYDRRQVAWYAAVLQRRWRADQEPPRRIFALSLTPAQDIRFRPIELTQDEMDAQVDRAKRIGRDMNAELWPPKPQSYCSICEARRLCPASAPVAIRGSVRLGA